MKKDSKAELLYSAFCEFAKNGFWGATTRDIAQRANINISSILYYFGGKKGIYAAALHNIVESVSQETSELSQKYDWIMERGDRQEARELLREFTQKFLYILCGENMSKDMKTVFFSEYSKPTEDFSILYDGLILPFHTKMANLLVLASGGKMSPKEASLYTFPFFAQLFVFSSRKDNICKIMEWQTYSEAEKQKLLDYMFDQIDFLLSRQK